MIKQLNLSGLTLQRSGTQIANIVRKLPTLESFTAPAPLGGPICLQVLELDDPRVDDVDEQFLDSFMSELESGDLTGL
ncbi:uncharacterized protein N7496_001127 [Penicillium cataractarum]|uniref:Uncharacterized protein n=1 Tax=Penicillium cataractarum TaxID=2100454 RepID=A0A9W9VVR5_9EURO|nr:uncharacterized protein N7496_001127 [Penicillium cataractarum]KAJ5390059.1 hypothetical protein N7496_001127 [Penicillium cataractarum]